MGLWNLEQALLGRQGISSGCTQLRVQAAPPRGKANKPTAKSPTKQLGSCLAWTELKSSSHLPEHFLLAVLSCRMPPHVQLCLLYQRRPQLPPSPLRWEQGCRKVRVARNPFTTKSRQTKGARTAGAAPAPWTRLFKRELCMRCEGYMAFLPAGYYAWCKEFFTTSSTLRVASLLFRQPWLGPVAASVAGSSQHLSAEKHVTIAKQASPQPLLPPLEERQVRRTALL